MVKAQLLYETYKRLNKKRKAEQASSRQSQSNEPVIRDIENPQLNLLLRPSPHFERSLPFPYEILLKIFQDVVEVSDHPLRDLCSLALVSETWRVIVVTTPSLWRRINFKKLPLTDGNLSTLHNLMIHEPNIIENIREVYLKGPVNAKKVESGEFLERILAAPKLSHLYISKIEHEFGSKLVRRIGKAISECKQLKILSIRNAKYFFVNQKWLSDHLTSYGSHLEELYLTSSMTMVSPSLLRSLGSDYCPNLRVLDLSVSYDFVDSHTFDAELIAYTMPNLKILRAANVSFRRVPDPPVQHALLHLTELSIPIARRDAYRDDALLGTLTYGSDQVEVLDLRGASISAHALLGLPSSNLRVLHIDDICPLTRKFYGNVVAKWRHSLEVLSLVKINCAETINDCLNALVVDGYPCNIREIDLQGSEVIAENLKKFLGFARKLQKINLSSCRSLPRGCKKVFLPDERQTFSSLKQKLCDSHSDSETEIDEQYLDLGPTLSRKRRRVTRRHEDFVYDA